MTPILRSADARTRHGHPRGALLRNANLRRAAPRSPTNTIDGYQKNGPTIDGPGSSARIENNTIDGGGPNPIIARNGIQVKRGAAAQVMKNTVSRNSYVGSGPPPAGMIDTSNDATGILVFEVAGGVEISSNTLTSNDLGLEMGIGLGNQEDPSLPANTTAVQVKSNMSSGNVFDALLSQHRRADESLPG